MLTEMQTDAEIGALGQHTVLGQPRKLQSAWLSLAKAERDPIRRIGYQFHLVPPPEVLAVFGAFTASERREVAKANRRPVPHILHQIWIGPKPPPITTKAWAAQAGRHGFAYRLWREAELRDAGIAGQGAFDEMLARGDYPGAVDVARYTILHDHGGLYLDCDWLPARDDLGFQDVLPLIGLSAMAEDVPRLTGKGSLLLANSVIAVPPAHPVMARMVEVLPQAMEALPGAPAWWSTGPLLFTVVARGAGAVTVAEAGLVAGSLPGDASPEQIESERLRIAESDGGLLLAWKPW